MKTGKESSSMKFYKPLKKFMLDSSKNKWRKRLVSLFTWFLLFELSRCLKKAHSQNAIKIEQFAWEGLIISACTVLLLSPGIAILLGATFSIMLTSEFFAECFFLGLWAAVVFSGAVIFTGLFLLPKLPRWTAQWMSGIAQFAKRNNRTVDLVYQEIE